jgi:hypothetical protein
MPIVGTGQITIADVNDGAASRLTTDSFNLVANSAGVVANYTGAETQFKITEGGLDTTNNWSYYVSATGGGISYRDSDDTADRTSVGQALGGLGGTNLLTNSNSVTSATGTTFLADQVLDPYGNIQAGHLTANTTSTLHEGTIGYTGWQNGTTYTLSGFIKQNPSSNVNGINGSSSSAIGGVGAFNYNFSTKVGSGGTFTELEGSWVRFSVTFVPTASVSASYFIRPTVNGSSSFTGQNTGFYIWGLQLETGTAASELSLASGSARSGTRGYVKITSLTQDNSYLDITAVKVGGSSLTKRFNISRSKAGVSPIVGNLTNPGHIFSASSDGTVSDYAGGSGVFEVYEGTTLVTSGVTYSIPTTPVGITAEITNAGAYTLSNMTTNGSTTVTFRAVYKGVTIDKVYTANKSRTASNGQRGSTTIEIATTQTAWNAAVISQIDSYFTTYYSGIKVLNDRVTVYNTSAGFSQTRYWDNTGWIQAASVVDGNLIVTGTVTGDKIAANSITTNKLLVTGYGNVLNADPNTQDLTAWSGTGLSLVEDEDSPVGGATVLNAAGNAPTILNSRLIPIDPNKNYNYSLWIKQHTGAATTYLTVAFFTQAGANIQASGSGVAGWSSMGTYFYFGLTNQQPPSTWTKYSVSFGPTETSKIPATARYIRVGFLSNYTVTTAPAVQRVTGIQLVEKTDGNLIVDGSIKSNKIDTRNLTIKDADGDVVFSVETSNDFKNDQITVSNGVLQGTGTPNVVVDNSYQQIGQNLIPNSDQTVAMTWQRGYTPNGTVIGTDIRWASQETAQSTGVTDWSNYVLTGGQTRNVYIKQTGVATGTEDGTGNNAAAGDLYVMGASVADNTIAVSVGERVCFSCYARAYRCDYHLYVAFFNSSGTVISYHNSDKYDSTGSVHAKSLSEYVRAFFFVTVPANAATATVFVRKYNTYANNADSYLFLAAPQFEKVSANATSPSPYMPGPVSKIGQLAYTGALNATRNVIYRQNAAPSGGTYTTGDLWIDTDSNPTAAYQWDGSGWNIISNYTTNTNQLTDGANLGLTATWPNVTGTGKPEDNATVGATAGTNLRDSSGTVIYTDDIRNNLANVDWWTRDATIPWGQNGEYNRIIQVPTDVNILGPKGGADFVWYAKEVTGNVPNGNYGENGGGWNGGTHTVLDTTKTYRFVLPIRRLSGTVGTAYWGTNNVCNINTTTVNGNPYFAANRLPESDRWYIFVGYVFPYESEGNTNDSAGIWDCKTGQKFYGGSNWNFGTTGNIQFRAYQYYADLNSEHVFGRPMINLVDGTEPSLREFFEPGAVLNTTITINNGAIQNIGTGSGTVVANTSITVDANGTLQGINSASNGTTVANNKISIVDGAIQGINSASNGISVANNLVETLTLELGGTGTVTQYGNTVKKTSTSDGWDSHAYSRDGYRQAFCSFKADQTNSVFMAGLNTDPATNVNYDSIDYAIYLNFGTVRIFESGSQIGDTFGSYVVGDIFSVTYDGSKIEYYKNGSVIRSVTVALTQPLYFDSSFYYPNTSISQIKFGPMSSNAWSSITGQPAEIYNTNINIDATGKIQGIDPNSSGTTVDNSKVTLSSTGKLLNGTTAQGQITTLTIPDTRNTNEIPNWYPVGTTTEFKTRTVIGAPGTGTYGVLRTEKAWADASGGAVVQTFKDSSGTHMRRSTTGDYTTWQPWTPVLDKKVTDTNISTYFAEAAIGNAYIADLNADKITAGTINANLIAAGSITASKLVLGDPSALNHNPSFEEGDIGWTKGAGWSIVNDPTNSATSPYCAVKTGNIDLAGLSNQRKTTFSYTGAGLNLTATASIKTSSANTSARVVIVRENADGTFTRFSGNVVSGTAYATSTATAIVISKSVKFFVEIQPVTIANTSESIYVDNVAFKQNIDASLIVNGTIVADKIDTRGLTIKDSNNNVIFSAGLANNFDNSYQTIGQNLIPNSDQTVANTWTLNWNPNSAEFTTVVGYSDVGTGWTTANYVLKAGTVRSVFSRQTTPVTGTVGGSGNSAVGGDFNPTGVGSNLMPVIPGERVCASCYVGSHRCNFSIIIVYINSAGDQIFSAESQIYTSTENYVNTLDKFTRAFVLHTVPANAAAAYIVVRKYNTYAGQGDSYIWMAAPQFEKTNANATGPSPYQPGPASDATQLLSGGQISSSNIGTYIADLTVNTLKIADNAVTLPFTSFLATSINQVSEIRYYLAYPPNNFWYPAYGAQGPLFTYTFNADYAGKVVMLWSCEASSLRGYRFRAYLNGPTANYQDVISYSQQCDAYGCTDVWTVAYNGVPDTTYQIGTCWAGNAFQDQPMMIGFGDAVQGTNTIRIWSETKNGGTLYNQRLVILGAKK